MRLGGIATGFDTESLINQLTEIERQPIRRAQQDIQEIEGVKDEWRDVNKQLSGVRDQLSSLNDVDTFESMDASSDHDGVGVMAENHAQEARYDLEVEQAAQNHAIGSAESIDNPEDGPGETGNLVLSIDGKDYTFEIDEADSLLDVVDDINNDLFQDVEGYEDEEPENIPISANVIAGSYLQLEADEPGQDHEITINDAESNGDILGWLNLEDPMENRAAQDAKVHINNELATINTSSNEIEIAEGVEIDISDLAGPGQLEDGESIRSNITVSQDTSTPMENVESFEETYNEVISNLEAKTDVTVIEDQTDGEDEVESGALQGDTTINNIMRNIRTAVTNPVDVEGKGITIDGEEVDQLVPAQFGIEVGGGITTGGYDPSSASELTVDRDRLEEQLEQNPEAVAELFSGDDGIAKRMEEYIDGVVYDSEPTSSQTHNRDGSIIENRLISEMGEIDRIEDQIERDERRAEQTEDRLWSEFTRMEQAMQDAMSEQQNMMSQIGNMNMEM